MHIYNGEEVSWNNFVERAGLISRERVCTCSRCNLSLPGLILKSYVSRRPTFLCWHCFRNNFDNNELFQQVDITNIIDVPAYCYRCDRNYEIIDFTIQGNHIVCGSCVDIRLPAPQSSAEEQGEISLEESSRICQALSRPLNRQGLDNYCAICHNRANHNDTNNFIEVNGRYGAPIRICERCNEDGEYLIHSYDYTPDFEFYSTIYDRRTLLYFGIELEIESMGAKKSEALKSLPDFVYVKRDGSLRDGIEIVSHPTTYKWLKENAVKWEEILNLRKRGWRSFQTETCGMHIHLSKVAFGNYHLYKFMRMFYNNPNFILYISQRKSNRELRSWASIKDTEQNIIYKAKHKGYGNESRHTAINLSRDNSVEVRIFKGTLHSGSFWKNIEFTKAVYDFSYAFPKNKMNEKEFRGFLRYKRKEYPNLHDFMWNEKQFIVEE